MRLSCSAVGDPTPRYQWTKDDSPVIPNAALENNDKTLQLTNIDSKNDGIYTCLAVNDAGDVSTSSNVTVHGRKFVLSIRMSASFCGLHANFPYNWCISLGNSIGFHTSSIQRISQFRLHNTVITK